MVEVKKYHLPPTDLIPNSPHPVLHYPGLLGRLGIPPASPERVHDLFAGNGWATQWIFRYGPTQRSHYHSRAHETMAVLSGTATIRFGVADLDARDHYDDDDDDNNDNPPDERQGREGEGEGEGGHGHGDGREPGGVEVRARAGDVFVLPAGTAHKTFGAVQPPGAAPRGPAVLLMPGDGHGVAAEDARAALAGVRLSGFTMMGAYPAGAAAWDFAVGGERGRDEYGAVWAVPRPGRDPVLGEAEEGLCGQWKEE